MKKTVLVSLAVLLILPSMFAQIIIKEEKIVDSGRNINLMFISQDDDKAQSEVYFGIYVQDLDFPTARKLAYTNLYGIVITELVKDSPAWVMGLQQNDIIMELDNNVVTNKAEFDRLRAQLKPGDRVRIKLWRDAGEQWYTMEMQPRPRSGMSITATGKPKKNLSPGYGGGAWTPYWFKTPIGDVNTLLANIGDSVSNGGNMTPSALSPEGFFMQGGIGKGHVGKGFFIGGYGAAYSYEEKDPTSDTSINYSVNFGGVTLDKRLPITEDFIASVGIMLGGGGHEVEFNSTDAAFTWPYIFSDNNFSAKIKREYFAVQPRAELMYRLLDWLAIRAEVGYLYGMQTYNGWKVTGPGGNDYNVIGSPNTPFKGVTVSIGPWFGF